VSEINYDPDTVKLNLLDWPEGAWTPEIEKLVREDLWNVRADGLDRHEDLIFHDFNSSTGVVRPSILVNGAKDGFNVEWCGEER